MSASRPYLTNCPACKYAIHRGYKDCLGCGRFIDFPNVRDSKAPDEVAALTARVVSAGSAAVSNKTTAELVAFRKASRKSEVVIARSLMALHTLLTQDNAMIASYYKQVASGVRIAGTAEFDLHRLANDSTINPFCSQELNFAALSLNGRGISWYGQYFLTLKDVMVGNRSNVFEENPTLFCKQHGLAGLAQVPKGNRAPWHRRQDLVIAKLHDRLLPKMPPSAFAELLMTEKPNGEDDFIEVQTYGPLTSAAISKITGPIPTGDDAPLWHRMRAKMDELKIQFVETT